MISQRCASAGTCLALIMLWFVCVEAIIYSGTTKFEISSWNSASGVYWRWDWAEFQDVTRVLPRGANKAPNARLNIRARGCWAREQSAFFDGRVCHPNADSYKNLTTEQIYKLHENDKKRLYSSIVLEVEQGTFIPLVFTTTGVTCQLYHSRLAELLAVKKQESYASTIAWITNRVLFAILRSALVCLWGSRSRRRTTPKIQETDLELEVLVACKWLILL